MGTATHMRATRLGGMLVLWLVAAFISGQLFGAEVIGTSHGASAGVGDVVLTVDEGMLSLRVQNASLKGIFEAIGRQLRIEVDTRIPEDERITLAFEQLSLMEALKQFRPYVNYLTLEDGAKAPGTIRTLIVVSKRFAGTPAPLTTQDSDTLASPTPSQREAPTPAAPARPQPFTFEFDPSAVGERGR